MDSGNIPRMLPGAHLLNSLEGDPPLVQEQLEHPVLPELVDQVPVPSVAASADRTRHCRIMALAAERNVCPADLTAATSASA
jgi:hypothetical protein